MTQTPRLLSLTTASPDHVLHQSDVAAFGTELFGHAYRDWARLRPVYANAEIDTRRSCVPLDWYREPHGFAERNALFIENAVNLLEQAAVEAIEKAGLTLADIDSIVTVSSSGIATPSLDALLLERLAFRRDVQRLPIFGLGCAGGVIGLARAAQMARAEPGNHVLYLVVELCGLTFRAGDRSKSNVVATALFGDGAAAAVVSSDGTGPAIAAWGEHTWPGSLDVMGWGVHDDGLAVIFSRDIPNWVRGKMGQAAIDFLSRHNLTLADIDAYVCHPGGAKVVEALEEIFGLQRGGLVHSRAVLREFGNMSAATIMFVLDRAMRAGQKGRQLLSTLGPGFTAAFLVLEAA